FPRLRGRQCDEKKQRKIYKDGNDEKEK
ncbi:hypothetical protein CEXT_326701, partial [Caerostris extrusa]